VLLECEWRRHQTGRLPLGSQIDGVRALSFVFCERGFRIEHIELRWENPVKIRSCRYLNNMVEQDHRRIKSRLQPMLGFQRFYNARRVIAGIELAQKIHSSFRFLQFLVATLRRSGVAC
jgi:transposase-like protein